MPLTPVRPPAALVRKRKSDQAIQPAQPAEQTPEEIMADDLATLERLSAAALRAGYDELMS